jgi:hypothetical protein
MEKKKIAPRKISSAEEQEKALKILLNGGDTPSVSEPVEQEKKIKKVKTETKKVETKSPPKAKRQPTVVRRKAQDIMKPLVEVQRVTIDLPVEIYDLLKEETEKKGSTLKWQIVNLLREHFKKS